MESPVVKFKKLHDDAILPSRGTEHSAGFDLCALQDTLIVGGEGSVVVPTGVGLQLPPGTYGRIAMRSGLSVKEHLAVSAGVIDLDYEDKPVGVVVYATKIGHKYLIKKGDRFAQLVIESVCYAKPYYVTEITPMYGNHKGWGSTGQ